MWAGGSEGEAFFPLIHIIENVRLFLAIMMKNERLQGNSTLLITLILRADWNINFLVVGRRETL